MASLDAPYFVVGVRLGGGIERWKHNGAPTDSWMISRGRRYHCGAVLRYYPTKRGWCILDIRKAMQLQSADRRSTWWRGQVRYGQTFPSEDAAVMAAIHMLA